MIDHITHVAGTVPVPSAMRRFKRRATARGACLQPNRGTRRSIAARLGLTLIELLVVIVILLVLTTVALPLLAPNTEGRRLREAARLVSTYVASARNRAIETGRPAGVQFERMANNLNASMVLNTVEVPPMYSGESLASRCTVYDDDGSLPFKMNLDPANLNDVNPTLIRVGDLVKFNYQGQHYKITGPAVIDISTKIFDIVPLNSSIPLRWPLSTNGTTIDSTTPPEPLPRISYQIIRQPVKTSVPALQLPEGTVVDLSLSGEGMNSQIKPVDPSTTSAPNPQMIFEPSGTVSAVFNFDFDDTQPLPTQPDIRAPAAPVHFLVGRIEGVETVGITFDTKNPWNLNDPRNLWVSVGSLTGLLSTAENGNLGSAATPGDKLKNARALAVQMQSTGGR